MTDEPETRCTDKRLFQLCEAFDAHVLKFEEHERKEEETRGQLLSSQHDNARAVGELTDQIIELVKDTRDIVKLHRDFQGVARLGKGIQDFMFWCLKVGGIVGAIGLLLTYIVDHYIKTPT